MTQSEFFSGIENNLRRLIESRITLPDYNLPGVLRGEGHQCFLRQLMKIKTLKKLTEKDPTAPANVRVYDLVSGALPGLSKQKFRVFAAYVEEPTRESYRDVKYHIRKWYQESGWADAVDKPYAGAIAVGSGKTWPDGMCPNADDIPFEHVVFQVLSSPATDQRLEIATATLGDPNAGAVIFRALGEDFDSQKKRVDEYVQKLFGFQQGHIFVDDVSKATGVPCDDVSNIFNDLQAEGKVEIFKKKSKTVSGKKSDAECMYVEKGPAPIWKRLVSQRQGAWYTKNGFCALLSVSTCGYLLYLIISGLKNAVSDLVSEHTSILLCIIGALAVAGCLLLAIRFILRNR